jgi:hypothetical protein
LDGLQKAAGAGWKQVDIPLATAGPVSLPDLSKASPLTKDFS